MNALEIPRETPLEAPLETRIRLPRDERRAQLLVAALEIFTVAGYHSAAMDEIAERAGVSKPVLYQHFPSKLELYLAVLDINIEFLVTQIHQAIASSTENDSRVRATVDAYYSFIDNGGESYRLLFENDMSSEPAVRERLNRMTHDCAEAVSTAISQDTGIPKDASMLIGVALMGCAQMTARHWLEHEIQLTGEEATGLITNFIWRGLSGLPRN